MRWFARRKAKLEPQPKAVPLPVVVPVEQWDSWAQELEGGRLRHDVYLDRLLHLPHIYTIAWVPEGEQLPRPLPFNNNLLQTVILPVFTGSDAVQRFAEVQQTDRPLVLQLPTQTAWAYIAALEIDGVTVNPGGRAGLSCDMQQVLMLAEASRTQSAERRVVDEGQ